MADTFLPSMRLDGQRAVVTGAGRGIGAGCALALAEAGAEVIVDFTTPDAVMRTLKSCIANGIHCVIGTTGFDDSKIAKVREWCAAQPTVGVLIAPNFGIGAVLMMRMAELASPYFESAEIIEMHHPDKVDAPSGTALKMGEVLANALGRDLKDCAVYAREGVTGERDPSSIGFATIRGGDIVGDHTVLFAGTGERIEQ